MASVAYAAAEEATEASGGGQLPQMDPSSYPSQLFWLFVTFVFLYMMMANVILPRLGGVIEDRRDRIADDLDQAAEFKREAEDAEVAYNKALSDARAKAQAIAAETRDAVTGEIAGMQMEAEQKAADAVAAAEARINEMKQQASEKVRDAAVETTKSIVSALIDENPTDAAITSAMAQT